MAPGLTPAEILARRKNYASAVIKAQNPPPRTPKRDVKEAAAESKRDDEEDQRAALRKWMGEKKRRDMESLRQKNREKQQTQEQLQPNRPARLLRKTNEVASKQPVSTTADSQKTHATPRSKSTMVIPKETRSDIAVGVKKVAFDDASCTQNSRDVNRKQYLQSTPIRPSLPKSNVRASIPAFATPSRLSSKKFETLSPDSKFGHWLQLKGKTPQQVKHIGCVTPASKSTSKKKKPSVSFSVDASTKHSLFSAKSVSALPIPKGRETEAADDPFASLLTRLETGNCTHAEAELTKLTGDDEENYQSRSRYWLCLAQLRLLTSEGDGEKTIAERKREAFASLEKAVDNAAKPKGVLAEGAKRIILKLIDLVEMQKSKSEAPNDTFTLRPDTDEKNDTYTMENETAGHSLTPPASPPTSGSDISGVAIAAAVASPIPSSVPKIPALCQSPALTSQVDGASNVASTPIGASPTDAPSPISLADTVANPSPVSLADAAAPPPFSLSLDTPTKTAGFSSEPLSPPLSPPLSDDEERVDETPSRRGDDASAGAMPLPGSPQSVAAELVTTSPHFIGVRHSKPVMELLDVSDAPLAHPLDESTAEAEVEDALNQNATVHNDTTATSGCSSMHEVTNVSTWANFDSNESLQVTELSHDCGAQLEGDHVGISGNDDDAENCADAAGLDAQSFSEIYLTGESSPVSDVSSTNLLSKEDALDELEEYEVSEEEANKENISPVGVPDVCADMNYVLMASPILDQSSKKLNQTFSHHVGQPFASSTVKLLVKDDAFKDVAEDSIAEDVDCRRLDESDEENVSPSDVAPLAASEGGNDPMSTTPMMSRKSILKSASTVVVTPVRRSIRQTPRAKATEEKRRLVGDLDDLSPQARKNSVLMPNTTIPNLSFGEAIDDDVDGDGDGQFE